MKRLAAAIIVFGLLLAREAAADTLLRDIDRIIERQAPASRPPTDDDRIRHAMPPITDSPVAPDTGEFNQNFVDLCRVNPRLPQCSDLGLRK